MKLLILIIILVMLSCRKDKPAPDPELPKIEVLWKTDLTNETYWYLQNGEPALYQDQVAYFTYATIQGKSYPWVFMDTGTGEIEATWNDYLGQHPVSAGIKRIQYQNWLVVTGQKSLNCIDFNTHQTVWQHALYSTYHSPVAKEGMLYFLDYDAQDQSYSILRTPFDHLAIDTVYTINTASSNFDHIEQFGIRKNQQGELQAAVILSHKSIHAVTIDFYNITSDSSQWTYQVEVNSSRLYRPPAFGVNHLYLLMHNILVSVNTTTGTEEWISDINAGVNDGFVIPGPDRIFVKTNGNNIIILNPQTGYPLKPTIGGVGKRYFPYRYEVFDGKVFYTGVSPQGVLGLYINSLSSGLPLLDEPEKRTIPDAQESIVLDTLNGLMYFSDDFSAICAQIPDDL